MSNPPSKYQDEFQQLLNHLPDWLSGAGEHGGIVISSRIRLARNLSGYFFPNRATVEDLEQIIEKITLILEHLPFFQQAYYFQKNALSKDERTFLMERDLVSSSWLKQDLPASAVVISANENVGVMINEEDHLRIQVLQAGLQIESCWEMMRTLDDELSAELDFSFSDQFGYLTACPTNTGTGMRVSVAVDLVGLGLKGNLEQVLKEEFSKEFTVRGFHGEGTAGIGSIYQISNQLTLGRTEEGIIKKFSARAQELVEMEISARNELYRTRPKVIEDKIYRAGALLSSAKIMDASEAINLLSFLRMGEDMNLINQFSIKLLNELMLNIQPAHLQQNLKHLMNSGDMDIEERPDFIRKKLKIGVE